jgi:CheY-like chemotaxis protein
MIGQELAVVVEGATAAVIRAEQIEVDESLVSVLSRIRVAAEAAYTGIAGLVDMSNPRRAVGEGINTEFKLRHFVASLISQVVHMAEENNVRLRVRIEQDVAEQLQGDIVRLRHGLKTLLECMLQIAPNEVTLAIEAEYFNESSMTARFSVVAANDRALTGKAGPTRPQTPTQNPVRLAIAKYAIAALGSELQRESSSVGTLTHGFSMTLQLSKKASDQPRMQYVSLNGMPVLIVSANAKQRLQLSNWLKTMRMLPLEADNAAMALALLTRLYEEGSPVPLVILENQLPVQDGFLLSFRIKFDDRLSATHIIMLTNQGKRGDALACKENGVAGYLPQPVGKSRLTDAIMAVTGASDDATQEPALQAKLVTRHSLHDQRKGATVLLIDNDPLMLEITEITLRKHDAALVIAASREEALTMAASDIYDMILVSVDLPDLSPENFVRSVKERLVKDADSTPVIAISKINRPTVEQQCLIWGFTGIMFKPVERDELIALITKVNRLKRLAREQAAQTAA